MFRYAFSILGLLLGFQSFSQKLVPPTISLHLEAGYGLALPAEHILQRDFTVGTQPNSESISLGTAGGLQLGAALGIELRNDFRFMVHGHYQRSYVTTRTNKVVGRSPSGGNVFNDEEATFRFSSFSMSALIQYRMTHLDASWYPYFNFGPSIYVWGQEYFTDDYYDITSATNYYVEGHTAMGLSLGGRASLGVERKLADKLFLSMGLQMRAAYLAPNLRTITLVQEEGEDITDQLPNSALQTSYVKEYNPGFTQVPSAPTPAPYFSRPLIGADLIFGLTYFFN